MSPTKATVVVPPMATPRAVDSTPSMPLAPRLAWATAAAPPNHSRSRTGIDEATTSRAPSGRLSATVRATPGSDSTVSAASALAIACSACADRSVHDANQSPPGLRQRA